MSSFRRITKREARRRFAKGLPFALCPCKMMPGGPWAIHSTVYPDDIAEYKEKATWYAPDGISPSDTLWEGTVDATAWDLLYNNWAFYNTSWETGYYAAYYVEE